MFNIRENYFVQALLLFAVAWLVITLSDVVLVIFVAFLATVIINPLVLWLRQRHVPVVFAVLTPIILLFAAITLTGYFIVPTLVAQVSRFIDQFPSYLDKLPQAGNININFDSLRTTLQGHFGTISNVLIVFTGAVVKVIVGLVSAFVIMVYWLGTYERSKDTLLTYFPKKSRSRAEDIWNRIEIKIGHWFRAQILLSIVVGLMVGFGSWAIGLPFPAVLGLISGVLELVPTLGPIVATVPGAAIGFAISIKLGLLTVLMHVLVQQIENHILAPWLMGRTVHLHPIIIIISLLIGTSLYGILGALLAVPVTLCISAGVDSFRSSKHGRAPGKPGTTAG